VGWKSVKNAFQFKETFRLRDDAARFEPGSSNHLGIHALHASLRLLADHPIKEIKRHCLELRREAARMLFNRGFEVLGADWDRRHRSPILAARPPGDASAEELASPLSSLGS
jgi:selenocysteine lyase/cysteine desulfurase